MSNAQPMPPAPSAPAAPFAPMAKPAAHSQFAREHDQLPTLDVYLRHLRQEVARALSATPDARAREEQHILSLAERAFSRYPSLDKTALPPPLKQIDAYTKTPHQPQETLLKFLELRRADLALELAYPGDLDDKDGSGDLSPDAGRDSDEDAIGSEHPKSPSLGPSASPGGTGGNTTVSSPEPRTTVSAPPQGTGDRKKVSSITAPNSVHNFTGDERCTNCILRNNPTCVVNSSRQRCDSCFVKRHRCSKVLTPPTRPTREPKSASTKGKATDGPSHANGESVSARAPKRKRTADDETKRTEPPKRPARPSRPAAATGSAAGASGSASAAAQRPSAPKKPPVQNGNSIPTGSTPGNLSLAALAASASRAPRAPTAPVPAQTRHQYYQEKLQVISGILAMVQTAVKELQDQVNADSSAR